MSSKISSLTRRAALKLMGVCGAAAALPAAAWAILLDHFPTRTVEIENFDFDPATGMLSTPKGERPYTLTLDGLVAEPVELDYSALRELPQVTQTSDFHCVEGWTVPDVTWSGVRFSEILKLVELNPSASWAIFHSLGETRSKPGGQAHYIESFPLRAVTDERLDFLLALDKDGEPLSFDRGAPLRVISPYDLAYKSIKYVERIQFASSSRPGWWTLANPIYPIFAPVPKSRLRGEKPERTPWF
jgi:DMSO/TMAO reductase YedYZ molybdopterin-dependent catalytic subunit